jgi:hypothetical protein
MATTATVVQAGVGGLFIWLLANLVIALVFPLVVVKSDIDQLNRVLSNTSITCDLNNVTAFDACIESGECIGGSVLFKNITTVSLRANSLTASSCTNVVPPSCIPQDMVKTTVSSPITTLFGSNVTCPQGPISSSCSDISGQTCSSPLAGDCFAGRNYTFGTITVNTLNVNNMTLSVVQGNVNTTYINVNELNVTNSTIFTGSVSCPIQPAIDGPSCIALGSATQCSSPITDSCVPSSVTLQNATVSSDLVLNQVTCANNNVFALNCFSHLGPNLTANVITANLNGLAASFTGTLSGDVTGTQGATTVVRLNTRPMSATTPTNGQVIGAPSAGNWAPMSLSSLAGTPVGDATGMLGAVVASKIRGVAVSNVSATEGQILQKFVSPDAWMGNSQTNNPFYSYGIEIVRNDIGAKVYAILKGAQYWSPDNRTYIVQREGLYRVRMASTLLGLSYFGPCWGYLTDLGDCMAVNGVCKGWAGNRHWDIAGPSWYNEGTAFMYAKPGDLISAVNPNAVATIACARCFIEIYRHSD